MSPKPKTPKEVTAATAILQARRKMTNWTKKRISGFAPMYRASGPDGRRITSPSGWRVLSTIIEETTGRIVDKEAPFATETEPITMAEITALAFVEKRVAQREFKWLKKHKVIDVQGPKNGPYAITPLFETWASLPDYVAEPLEESEESEESEPEEPESEEQAKEATVTHLTEKPVRVAAGKTSKPVKVECGVNALQFSANVDGECSAVVKGGVLLVNWRYEEKSKSGDGRSNAINNLTSDSRHHVRISPKETTGKGTKGERGTKSETPQAIHPRAVELSNLFDPLIFKWCKKTLSGDAIALSRACEAIGDTPHDEVVRAAVERGGRTLTPLHVPSVCKEIAHNWEKAKEMPERKASPSSEELQDIIRRSKLTAAQRAAESKGRVA